MIGNPFRNNSPAIVVFGPPFVLLITDNDDDTSSMWMSCLSF